MRQKDNTSKSLLMLKPQEWDNTSTDNKYGIQYVRANHNK